jgi:uncharacterized protein YkwD
MSPPLPPPGQAAEVAWVATSSSPTHATPTDDPLERAALARCGDADAGVSDVAHAVLHERIRTGRLPDPEWTSFVQRSLGEPHPWARAWATSGKTLAPDDTMARLDAWLATGEDARYRRCGVASGTTAEGNRVLAVVTVEAFADLSPLPTRGRTGQWLTVEAQVRSAARGGDVVVMGPNGVPHRVATWLDGRALRARFALDGPGEFTVQVMADTGTGPRPVLEALVFSDVPPRTHPAADPAPGENDVASSDTPDDAASALAAMLSEARASAGLTPLTRDSRLDTAAARHSALMSTKQSLAHDAGDGDPGVRIQSAGVAAREQGENVAVAPTVVAAHRALWASPSHRANILHGTFTRVGIGVTRDAHGMFWVTEDFSAP